MPVDQPQRQDGITLVTSQPSQPTGFSLAPGCLPQGIESAIPTTEDGHATIRS